MKKRYSHMVGEYEFTGDTKAEAKAAAQAAIEETFSGRWCPEVLQYRGKIAIVSRSPWGWQYQTFREGEGGLSHGCTVCGDKSFAAASASARFALAQSGWTEEDGLSVPDFVTDPESRSDLLSWQKWQLRYAHFKNQGHSPDVCHAMACDSHYEVAAA